MPPIPRRESEGVPKKKSLVRILFIALAKPPVERLIEDDLLPLSQLLNDAFMDRLGLANGLALLVDRDALQKQLPINFEYGKSAVLGPAVLVRYNRKGDLIDLSESDIADFIASARQLRAG